MTDDNLALVRAKIALELADYRANEDRRHLAAIAEMMAKHIGIPDAGSEIRTILLSEKTLPKLQATVGTQRQLEDAENGSAKVCHGSGGIVLLRAK